MNPTNQTQQDTFLSQNSIKHRGWTVQAIKRFLGEPDRRESNRLLWRESRVAEVESTGKFRAWQAQRMARSQRRHQSRSDTARRKTFAELHPPELLPTPEGFYEALDQIRQRHPYLINRPILPAGDGVAIIEVTKEQWGDLCVLMGQNNAEKAFSQHGLTTRFKLLS